MKVNISFLDDVAPTIRQIQDFTKYDYGVLLCKPKVLMGRVLFSHPIKYIKKNAAYSKYFVEKASTFKDCSLLTLSERPNVKQSPDGAVKSSLVGLDFGNC